MLKIVVFDGGWGGNIVAGFLRQELLVADIIKVIDWEHASYENKTPSEICSLAEEALRKYLGQVDLVVLAGYSAALAVEYLQQRYPSQKIVAVGVNYYQILHTRNYPKRITLLMNQGLLQTTLKDELCKNLPNSTLTIPDCSGWENLANDGELSGEIIQEELLPYYKLHNNTSQSDESLIYSDVVLLLNTHFWDLKEEIEQVFGFRTRVIDFRQKLLHDVCSALQLLGVDGCRSK